MAFSYFRYCEERSQTSRHTHYGSSTTKKHRVCFWPRGQGKGWCLWLYLSAHAFDLFLLTFGYFHQLLTRLLKSGRAEDLETANRLIKSTLKEVRRDVMDLSVILCMPTLIKVLIADLHRSKKGLRRCQSERPLWRRWRAAPKGWENWWSSM